MGWRLMVTSSLRQRSPPSAMSNRVSWCLSRGLGVVFTSHGRRSSSGDRGRRSLGPPVDGDAVIPVEIIVIFFVVIVSFV